MDLFSHALLPYLLGNVSKIRKEYLAALVIGGIAPDFDIFILWINSVYPNFFLTTHRGITHSFFFGFFTVLLILYLATRERVKKKIRRFVEFDPVFTGTALAFAYTGVVIHLFLDFVTTRGIPLLYPLATTNYSAEVFFFTDTYLTILSLGIVVYLFKRPQQENTAAKFLIVFIIAFAVLGGLRLVEKDSAEDFFQGSIKESYPTMNPFEWYVVTSEGNEITVYKYNGRDTTSTQGESFSSFNILSNGEALEDALETADELPQVKMFKWRAYALAINASFDGRAWLLEYYDPIRKVQMRDAPSTLRRAFARMTSLEVRVEQGKAMIF